MAQYIDLPEVTTGGVDYVTTGTIKIRGGDISVVNLDNTAFDTPYQMKYSGMLVKFASDGDLSTLTGEGGNTLSLTPGKLVVAPCGNGERPCGWVYITTLQPTLLGRIITGGSGTFLPLTADLTSGTAPAYAQDYSKWVKTTVAALHAGDIVGMPMAAATTMKAGAEVASAALGVVENASASDVVIGIVKTGNVNAGAIGTQNVEVMMVTPYVKS